MLSFCGQLWLSFAEKLWEPERSMQRGVLPPKEQGGWVLSHHIRPLFVEDWVWGPNSVMFVAPMEAECAVAVTKSP